MINVVHNKTQLTNNMTEDFETELMGFDQPSYSSADLDDPETLSDEPFTEDLNSDLEQELDEQPDPQETEEIESQQKSVSKNKKLGTMLVKVLRDEINNKKEFERDFLRFRYRGEVCDGVPMAEINPSRFVFKIDGILKGINLSEIKIL